MRRRRHLGWLAVLLTVLASACGSDAETGTTADNSVPEPPTTTSTAAAEPVPTTLPPRTLVVPSGAPPTIDGTVAADEWAGAAVTVMDDGTELHWLHADGSLYLGVVAEALGAVNMVIAVGDDVRVLHSSAALGSAGYERDGERWTLIHNFDWCCRRTGDAESLDSLLEAEGWLATNGYAGTPGQVEYRVLLDGDGVRAGVSYVYTSTSVAFWPADLDETVQETLYGARRDSEIFAPDEWMTLLIGE